MIVDRIALFSNCVTHTAQASTGLVRYIARKRVGGEVVLAEAIARSENTQLHKEQTRGASTRSPSPLKEWIYEASTK